MLKPTPAAVFTLRLDSFGDWTLIMAGNVPLTLPVVLIFLAFPTAKPVLRRQASPA